MDRQEVYKFIGELALCLSVKGIKITFDSLNSILNDRGISYESNRGLASAVSAAYRYWEDSDPAMSAAIAHTYKNRNGQAAWDM